MTPRLRKFALTAHVTFSVGWLGAVVAYLALAIFGMNSQDVQLVRAVYLAMELIGWFVIVPLSIASLLTGIIQSLGTPWGLFRHYWVLAKLLLTIGGTIILVVHMKTVSHVANIAGETTFSLAGLDQQRIQLVIHPLGGLLVLLVATVLAVYKPWGKISWGRLIERIKALKSVRPQSYILLGFIVLFLLFIAWHLIGGRSPGS
ncbi:MAG: DUF2269 domain-containing protein [Oligoflexia bacterium]|nr:DUF2269 domain-containing protein [Oligoflexia bacterium]